MQPYSIGPSHWESCLFIQAAAAAAFHRWVMFYAMQLFTHSPTEGCLGYLLLSVIFKAVINI